MSVLCDVSHPGPHSVDEYSIRDRHVSQSVDRFDDDALRSISCILPLVAESASHFVAVVDRRLSKPRSARMSPVRIEEVHQPGAKTESSYPG